MKQSPLESPPEAPARLHLRLGMVLLPRGGLTLPADSLPRRSAARSCWACRVWRRGCAHAQGEWLLSGPLTQRDQRQYGASCCHQRDARAHLDAPCPGGQAVPFRGWCLLLLVVSCVYECVCAPGSGTAVSCTLGSVLQSGEGCDCAVWE